MSKEILQVVDAVSNEKGVEESIIFEALEAALASATRKRHGGDIEVRVAIDRDTGDYDTFRQWEIVEDDAEMEFPLRQITLSAAQYDDPTLQLGGFVEEEIESVDFGRIAAQTAKQVIVQKVREAERAEVVRLYAEREGELVAGIVKKTTRDGLIIDLGDNAEGFLPRGEMIHGERYRLNERVRALLWKVDTEARGSQLILSRTRPDLLIELFTIEVPEIAEQLIEIKGAARVCRPCQTNCVMNAWISSCGMTILPSWSSTPWHRPMSAPFWSTKTPIPWMSLSPRTIWHRPLVVAVRTCAWPVS